MSKQQKKIKIFIDGEVICLDHFSGIGHYTAALLKELDLLLGTEEFSHIEATLGVPWRLKHMLQRFDFKNYRVRRMPVTPQIANGLKSHGLLPPIDLLYGKQTYIFPHFSTWPTLNSPVIPVIYDLSFVLHPEFSADRNATFLQEQVGLAVKRSSKIITISTNSKQEIVDHYHADPKDVGIIYPIIQKDDFYPRNIEEIKQVRAKYGIFHKYILFVGNIEPRKNLSTLLRAYALLDKNELKDYALVLVGAKGWKDQEIRGLIEDLQAKGLKVIQPTSWVTDEDMPALVSGADAFVYVSRYEGFGIPPVEAMFCGTPVVASDNSSLPEAVGDAALKVNAEDTTAIKDAIERILHDPKLEKSLVQKGFEHIKKDMFKPELGARELIRLAEAATKESEK